MLIYMFLRQTGGEKKQLKAFFKTNCNILSLYIFFITQGMKSKIEPLETFTLCLKLTGNFIEVDCAKQTISKKINLFLRTKNEQNRMNE